MLKSLSVTNYALIHSLELNFSDGFSVITGETGAGKSVLLGAMGLLAGNRADTSAIRQGATKCVIEGVFDVADCDLQDFFLDNDLEYDDECIVRRELLATGKSRAFVNDTPATLAQLKVLGTKLIDIHSQHQNLLLETESFQREVLDILAGNGAERVAYADAFAVRQKAAEALRRAQEEDARNRADEEFIRYQLNQFSKAKLKAGEQEELEEEQDTLEHAEEIKADLYTACERLSGDEHGVTHLLRECLATLTSLSRHYPQAEEWQERMRSALIELKDIAEDLDSAAETVSFDPDRLAEVQERLDLIYTLQQKHHADGIDQLLAIERDFRSRLQSIVGGSEMLEDLAEELRQAEEKMTAAAAALTATRRRAATVVEQEMVARLRDLGMPNIRFAVRLDARTAPAADGMDIVTFLFSANRSSALQAIADVASGGEISRVMLAIKALTASARQLPTIVFDEIDTGVSGHIADRMGAIMQQMGSQGRQIISITHLPQIAAKGTAHYHVSKTEGAEGTVSSIVRLTADERVDELAAMVSGSTLTPEAIANAKALLGQKE